MNYYNDFDPKCCAWMQELMSEGLIPEGHIDNRSVKEVSKHDLDGYTQCHFFAGISGWPLALQLAGWPKSKPVWTGSCPCQPFSNAGARKGTKDPRHLWPEFFKLIKKCRPDCVIGEQVASAVGHGWWDLVCRDLERENYACGAAVLGAHSCGAPHIRQRLYWVALADGRHAGPEGLQRGRQHGQREEDSSAGGLANSGSDQRGPWRGSQAHAGPETEPAGRSNAHRLALPEHRGCPGRDTQGQGPNAAVPSGAAHRLGHAGPARLQACQRQALERAGRGQEGRAALQPGKTLGGLVYTKGRRTLAEEQPRPEHGLEFADQARRSGPTNGFWAAADWLFCTDGKWRPVSPGTFPLAVGVPGRVALLRGAGNAICPPLAAEFVKAFQELVTCPKS